MNNETKNPAYKGYRLSGGYTVTPQIEKDLGAPHIIWTIREPFTGNFVTWQEIVTKTEIDFLDRAIPANTYREILALLKALRAANLIHRA